MKEYTLFDFKGKNPTADELREHGEPESFDEQTIFYHKGHIGFKSKLNAGTDDSEMQNVADRFAEYRDMPDIVLVSVET